MLNLKTIVCFVALLFIGVAIQAHGLELGGDSYLMTSDTGDTYAIYLNIAETGEWDHNHDSILTSSLMTTLFPATLARLFGLPPIETFKGWNMFFLVFLPASVFILVKNSSPDLLAFSSGLLVAGNFYYKNAYQVSRLSIALLFFVLGLIIIAYTKKPSWRLLGLLPCAVLVVVSHYGIALLLGGIIMVGYAILRLGDSKVKPCFGIYGFQVLGIGLLFYSLFPTGPLHYIQRVALDIPLVQGSTGELWWLTGGAFFNIAQLQKYGFFWWYSGIWSLAIFWLAIAVIITGLLRVAKRSQGAVFAVIGLVVFALTMMVPAFDKSYGVLRVFYSILPLTAPLYANGLEAIGGRLSWMTGLFLSILNYFVVIGY